MHAYLVTGLDEKKLQSKVQKLIETLGTKRLDFVIQKISDIRDLSKFTNLTISEKTAVVINNFEKVGEEAQNAFLKALEEPQDNLYYILTCTSQDALVPTIVSRCMVIEVAGLSLGLDTKQEIEFKAFFDMSVGEKLNKTSKITKREDALSFTGNLLTYLHKIFLINPDIVHSIEVADQTLRNLEKNGNVQIQLTNLVISLI